MSFRLRLALWIGGVATVSITFIVVAALAVHGRTHYNSLDSALVEEAEHFQSFVIAMSDPTSGAANPRFDSAMSAQLYAADGNLLAPGEAVDREPPLSAVEVIARDDGPAYGAPWNWLPRSDDFHHGWFATTRDPESGDRIRMFVSRPDGLPGDARYIETWTSLASLDRSIERVQLLLFGLAAVGVVVAFVGGVFVAHRVLIPISTLTQTARAITASRGFSRRVPERGVQDELGQLERTLNEMLQSLGEAYRAQQQFVADAAHELRTPLTSIRGNIHVLARMANMRDDEDTVEGRTLAVERAEAIAYLDGEAARMSQMVDELLTLARADSGHSVARKPVEFDAVLLSAVAELSVVVGGRSVTVDQLEPVQLIGDELRLKQLILIILDNALKYTGDDGVVTVGLRSTGDEAFLEVADTGIGIATDDIPHLFERFYRGDDGRAQYPGGTGLGLSIARWVVDVHDGYIIIESTLGQGTRVTVRLPLERELRPQSVSEPNN